MRRSRWPKGIAGTEQTFAKIENQLAKQIGLTGSHFTNATGLPDPDHVLDGARPRDARALPHQDVPEYYPIFSEPEFTWNKIKQPNRNSLLEMGIGVDGLKTGHTEAAGLRRGGLDAQWRPPADRGPARPQSMTRARRGSAQAHHLGHARLRAASGLPEGQGRRLRQCLSAAPSRSVGARRARARSICSCPRAPTTARRRPSPITGPLRPPVQQGAAGRASSTSSATASWCRRRRSMPPRRSSEGDLVRKVDGRRSSNCARLAVRWMLDTLDAAAPAAPASSPSRAARASASRRRSSGCVAALSRATRSPPCAPASPAARPRPKRSAPSSCRAAPKAGAPGAEAVLFAAARLDHVNQLIAPNLDAGNWVISDRFHEFDPRLSGPDRRRRRQADPRRSRCWRSTATSPT